MRLKKGILYWLGLFIISQACSKYQFNHAFENIPETGVAVPLSGTISIDQTGGHLQGIQLYDKQKHKYLFMSGSSSDVAYMVKAQLDGSARILGTDSLLLDPYRHAGGFQIYDQFLAVGIEDNKRRNTSRVMVYDLGKSEGVWSDPLQVITREGEYERVTAGAVGITKLDDQFLIAVANWDSRNLDFYFCEEDKFIEGEKGFRLIGSLELARISRENWSDTIWHSYQNINLFTGSGNQLYLMGFATNENGNNVADLYKLDIDKSDIERLNQFNGSVETILIKKISTRTFKLIGNTSFRSGAGTFRNDNGLLSIFVCPEHIDQNSKVGVYSMDGY